MARFAISLLFLLLVASYASASTLEELCSSTTDAGYCVEFLKPTVSKHTDFASAAWHKKVLSRALARAQIAKKFIASLKNVPEPDAEAHNTCAHGILQSARLLKQARDEYGTTDVSELLVEAAAGQDACCDALRDAGKSMAEVKTHANQAATSTKIAMALI